MSIRIKTFLFFALLSYFPALAQVDTAWVRRYNSLFNGSDIATALAVDDSGNVYVTGYVEKVGGNVVGITTDYATVKYASNGDLLWAKLYNGTSSLWDEAYAITVDKSRNVYVTGKSYGNGTSYDYSTIKYAPNGDTLWVRRYNGLGNGDDVPNALAIDNEGNAYITGSSWSGSFYDYTTIKYNAIGETLWVKHYNGAGYQNVPYALAVDDSENVYVTGFSFNAGTWCDYSTIKYSSNGDTVWVRAQDGLGHNCDFAYAIALDDSGNVYVTGILENHYFTVEDYGTVKYSGNGDVLWVTRYTCFSLDWGGYDAAHDIAIDNFGNVCVTGNSCSDSSLDDYVSIKYSSSGESLWVARYNGPGNREDTAYSIVVDGAGNFYVTGASKGIGTSSDYATIKYSPLGETLWVRRYNGPGNGTDRAIVITVDKNENVYVTGTSWDSVNGYDFTTIKYVQFSCLAKPGDADRDSTIQISDIVAMINFLFKGQPALNPSCRGDANADGKVLLSDIVYLINFLFKSGPAPVKNRECCL